MKLQVSENLRYLLWKAKEPREEWETKLTTILDCDRHHAREVLLGEETLSPNELTLAAATWNYQEDDLLYEPLAQNEVVSILQENIRYLLDSLEWGKKSELAEKIGVHVTTISKWGAEQKPSSQNLDALKWNFGIPPGTNLEADPLFLSLSPIGDSERRQWLRRQIDRLDRNTLIELFPALERLLK